MLETIWVNAQYVNPPNPQKPNNPNGSIKDPVLGYISVPPQALPQFQKGKRYCIQIETTAKGYKNFISFANPAPQPAPQSTAGNFTGAPQQIARPVAQTIPQRQRLTAPPQTFAQQFDAQALNIFVTGVTGRALGSGHFLASDITELVREAKDAFMKHLSGVQEIASAPHQTSAPEPEYNEPLPDPSQYGAQPPVDDWQQ